MAPGVTSRWRGIRSRQAGGAGPSTSGRSGGSSEPTANRRPAADGNALHFANMSLEADIDLVLSLVVTLGDHCLSLVRRATRPPDLPNITRHRGTTSRHTMVSIRSNGIVGWSTNHCDPISGVRKLGGSSASKKAIKTECSTFPFRRHGQPQVQLPRRQRCRQLLGSPIRKRRNGLREQPIDLNDPG